MTSKYILLEIYDQHLNFKTNYHADVNDGHKITRTLILASTTILIYTLFFY